MNTFYNKANELDQADFLAHFKNKFVNDPKLIYIDGNSLGKLPKRTIEVTHEVVNNEWGNRLIRGWNEGWINLSSQIAKKIAKIVGAREDEIFVGDSTSLNLFKLAFAALNANTGKSKIISEESNFPTDLYVLQGLIENQFKTHHLSLLKNGEKESFNTQEFESTIDNDTALVTLSYVAYKSSFMHDMKYLNNLAHKNESYVIWDLSHAVGAVEVDLNKNNADMAVGCTYKYLNGGPGAPAFLYVRKDLQDKMLNPIWSWFGHKNPFQFDLNYIPNESTQKFAIGTPSIISLAAMVPGLDIILEADIQNLRKKSIAQSQFLMELIQDNLVAQGVKIASPLDVSKRGSHITIQHPEAYRICKAMIEPADDTKVIIPDFRPPNNIRLGIAPLYNSFMDMYETVERIEGIIKYKEYENFSNTIVGVS